PAECERILGGANAAIVRLNAVVYPARAARELADRMIALVRAQHAKHPLEPGAPLQSIREQLGAGGDLTDAALRLASTELAVSGPIVRLATWSPTLDANAERRRASILQAVTDAGREPPSAAELDGKLGKGSAASLRLLGREGLVVPVEHDRWYAREAVRGLVTALRSHAKPEREYSPSELREVLGFSRKFLIPFLEFCDRQGITERRASGRRVRPAPSP
ncbi:MAG TPA: SelB C-terminal domain-containing protein, partial [Gemmatimonadaceae bacterium]|nr:SelB C-terminal domain-containing protein [Gemmatimonadaceae bacterium]